MNKVLKSFAAATASAAVLGVTIAPAVSAWGDNTGGRRTYTIAEINNGALDGKKAVFNSIKDTSENALTQAQKDAGIVVPLSDERDFVGARDTSTGDNGKNNKWYGNTITVEEGKEYYIRLYVHNNSITTAATNVRVSIELPQVISTTPEVNGYIDADNASPSRYWDNVIFKSADNRAFYLDYVEGSALYENNGKLGDNGGTKLSDEIVHYGPDANAKTVMLGFDKQDGTIPGCYYYSGVVTIKVKPVFESSSIEQKVRLVGDKEWKKSVDAKVGDKVEYQTHYTNLNTTPVDNVVMRASLPTNMKYVAGSTMLFNSLNPNGATTNDNTIAIDGVNIGGYNINGDAYVRFTAEVVDKDLVCGTNRLINWMKASANGFAVQNSADVYVEKSGKSCEKPATTEKPSTNPGKLPETGAEIVSGVVGAGSIVTAAGYFIASRKQLR